MSDRRRVVVTGLGAVTPYGVGVEPFWHGCLSGCSGVTELRLSDLGPRAAGQVDFALEAWLTKLEARRLSRFCQFALVAAREALADASVDPARLEPERIGVALGTGSGALVQETQQALATRSTKGWAALDPLSLIRALPDMAAANVGLALGVRGPILTCVASCSSATVALAQALDLIRNDRADMVIAGGAEAWLTPVGIASFLALRALSTRRCPPREASCPYDKRRDGFVPAEAAGVLVLESEEHAALRGVPIRAELAGAAVNSDGFHVVAPRPDGGSAARCMVEAMRDAGVKPDEVDYINAHGTSTQLNDAAEAKAIETVWAEEPGRPLLSSTKSLIGHALGASGAVETVAVVKTIEEGAVHPGINLVEPDPACQLRHVGPAARQADVRVVLKNSFAFGGQNACLVVRRYE